MATTTVHYTDAVIGLLTNTGWYQENDLIVKGVADRPVFTKEGKKKTYRCVVGPLWTTYYDIRKNTIGHMDSIKTQDIELIKAVLKEFTCG